MTNQIEFYYDFVSPYTYLAHKRIVQIQKLKNIKFIYKPILLGGLHNLRKITPAAFIEAKKKFVINDCNMIAKKFNIEFKFNENFPINSLNLMRGALIINDYNLKNYIEKFFDAYWSSNLDLSNNKVIAKVLKDLNIGSEEFFKKISEQKVKDLLKKLTQKAYDKEIFGAPSFIVNKKLFWGQDRLDYALEEYKKSI